MYQKIVLVGNLGRDPEMRYTPGGTAVTNLSVATNRVYTNSSGEQIKETAWFRVSVWGKQAEACQEYLRKGRQVLVEGRLSPDENGNPRVWTRQDGTPAASYEVNAVTVRFLGGRAEGAGSASGEAPGFGSEQGSAGSGAQSEDDIPF
jgi:single-strand DNA-binding protein